jgi:hypothetical protein
MSRRTATVIFAVAALVALGCLLMFRLTTGSAEPPNKSARSDFASNRAPAPADPVPFDAKRAMGYLDDVCAIGPRISGTDGMEKQQALLKKHFEDAGGKVELQKFTARQASQKKPVEMANLIVSYFPDREKRIVLCSHYDTRPIADQERDPRKWHDTFISANDGGSGVALLMELANHLKDLKTEVGVDLVFFDGEEYVWEKSDRYFFGSEHFAAEYRKNKPKYKYVAGILLDMVGGKNARFPLEPNSWFNAQPLCEQVWGTAAELKAKAFVAEEGTAVEDDHVALNRGGIPTIDIIDFSYAHWHKLTDTPENCSGDSLEQVAKVLSVWLQRVK